MGGQVVGDAGTVTAFTFAVTNTGPTDIPANTICSFSGALIPTADTSQGYSQAGDILTHIEVKKSSEADVGDIAGHTNTVIRAGENGTVTAVGIVWANITGAVVEGNILELVPADGTVQAFAAGRKLGTALHDEVVARGQLDPDWTTPGGGTDMVLLYLNALPVTA